MGTYKRKFRANFPFTTAIMILKPVYSNSHGVVKKTFSSTGNIINCSFKTYGGTESTNNDLLTVIDTAEIETWFTPEITSDCRIKVLQTNKIYEVLGEIENIEMRNQFAKFRVRAVFGGA